VKAGDIGIHQMVKVLSEADIQSIHQATLQVLKEVGVVFDHPRALEMLERAGAKVDGQVVQFPPEMVERFIKAAPQEVTLCARNPLKNIVLGRGGLYYTNGYGATFVQDLETGDLREALLKDLIHFTILSDYLENVHYVLTQVIPQDISPDIVDVVQSAEMLRHTEKHVGLSIVDSTFIDEVIQIGRLASSLLEGENCRNAFFSLGAVSLSPLRFSRDGCHRLIRMAEEGVITRITSIPVSGGTSPVTLAGTLVQANAEVLAGIGLVQTISPGNPVLYGFSGGPLDMRRGKSLLGTPEGYLMNAALAQICDFYKIPFGYGTGGLTDSSRSDQQSGNERALTVLYAALSGVNVVHHASGGLLGGAMVSSYEEMILANELCRMTNRGLQGIKVTEETLAVDVIREVGAGGNFLNTNHTAVHFKEELFLSDLVDRRSSGERCEEDSSLVLMKAREMARHILKQHKVPGFNLETEKKIQSILDGIHKNDVHVTH
jgi:trimethylamine---corrinoid protein Co-methyltransferase